MPTSLLKAFAIGAVVVIGVLTFFLAGSHGSLILLQQENLALRERAERLDHLLAENQRQRAGQVDPAELARLRKEHEELLNLRTRVEQLQRELDETAKTAAVSAAPPPITPGIAVTNPPVVSGPWVMAAEAKDVGADTPEHLLQSWVWALCAGDTNRIQGLWDWPSGVPDGLREEFLRTVAEATQNGPYLSNDDSDMTGFRVLACDSQGNTDFNLQVDCVFNDGSHSRSIYRIRRSGNEWRLAIGNDGLPLVL
jgi:hypothetical protein